MSKAQPGSGYGLTSSGYGFSLNTEQPFAGGSETAPRPPFTIVDRSEGETYKFSAVPGTINSVIPQIGVTADATKRLDKTPIPTTTFNFGEDGYSYISLKVSADYSDAPVQYPVITETDILYPRIISNSTQQFATIDSAFFLLATAYKDPTTNAITIYQLTTQSQWSDRIAVSAEGVPYYFFARA